MTCTEKQYYVQLDKLTHAIIHINLKGVIVYCNPAVEGSFGYSISELIGLDIERLIPQIQHKTQAVNENNNLQKFTNRQTPVISHALARRKNGEFFPVDINLNTLYLEEGLLVCAEFRDITETSGLAQQCQYIENAFIQTTDGIIITDDKGRILVTNPALTDMLGYPPEVFTGKQTEFLYENKEEYTNILSLIHATDNNAQNQPRIVKLRRQNTSSFPAEILFIPVWDKPGEQNGFFFIVRDISERLFMEQEHKSLVKQLARVQKMEALGQLTGGVAHDFNNILASIMGFTELAIELLHEEHNLDKQEVRARFCDYLNEIHTSGRRATTLIEQMLTFSRSGNNGALKPFNVSILVNEVIKLLRPVLPASISIHAHLAKSTPLIMADPVQVHQILMNICINARDAMVGRGRIDITLAETSVSNEICTSCRQVIAGNYLGLAIQDTGPGIHAKVKERLFEPLFTTKKAGKGTGMGLAMAHGIIHHHKGHIIVESEPGLGSKFHILFPLIRQKPGQHEQQADIEYNEYEAV